MSGLHNTYKQPILPGDIKVIIDNENYFTLTQTKHLELETGSVLITSWLLN